MSCSGQLSVIAVSRGRKVMPHGYTSCPLLLSASLVLSKGRRCVRAFRESSARFCPAPATRPQAACNGADLFAKADYVFSTYYDLLKATGGVPSNDDLVVVAA